MFEDSLFTRSKLWKRVSRSIESLMTLTLLLSEIVSSDTFFWKWFWQERTKVFQQSKKTILFGKVIKTYFSVWVESVPGSPGLCNKK